MTEQTISLERLEDTINLFGSFDENIRLIEHELGVSVISRDSQLKVSGEGFFVNTAHGRFCFFVFT